MSYEDACYRAAVDQGLAEIVARLATQGVAATIEQTGGFCMVAYVIAGRWRAQVTSEGAGAQPVTAESYDDGWVGIIDGGTPAEIVSAVVAFVRNLNTKGGNDGNA
jgi:hypothetical protein